MITLPTGGGVVRSVADHQDLLASLNQVSYDPDLLVREKVACYFTDAQLLRDSSYVRGLVARKKKRSRDSHLLELHQEHRNIVTDCVIVLDDTGKSAVYRHISAESLALFLECIEVQVEHRRMLCCVRPRTDRN